MRRRGFGRIVNISSISGRLAVPHMAPYTASKFALTGLSDAVRTELEPYGIRVTTVSPGLMRTGSPLNAWVKGQHEAEYAWFSISDSTPGLSTSAEEAARQIIEACRYGDPALTITVAAKLGVLASHVAPRTVARMMFLANRLLPDPTPDPDGTRAQRGRDSETPVTRSFATALTRRAAAANNE
jgi:NAD(P)-dependent dehydrogenase (short-subunit alcohol dehydrogenase family)